MRNYLLLFLGLLCWTTGFPQHVDSTERQLIVKQLTPQGMVLTTGWKFHAGDDPAFASLRYNDSQWAPINPALEVRQLRQLKPGIVWLRLHLLLDSALPKQLGVIVHQSGASEIYFNGTLVQRFGTLSNHLQQVEALDPKGAVVPLQGAINGKNVLAIRYALQPGLFYTTLRGRQNPAFQATLLPLLNAIELYQRENTRVAASDMIRIGVFLLFFIFHFAMYLYFPAKKANLFFSLFALFSLFSEVLDFNLPHEMRSLLYYKYAASICTVLSVVFLFVGYYTVLNEKRGWVFWSIMAIIPLAALLVEFGWGGVFTIFLPNLVYIEIIRLIVKAIRSKHKGAWLFAAGATSYVVFWTLFLLGFKYGYNFRPIGETFLYADLLFCLAVLSNPVFISIYLGIDFALTSKTLSQKLREVETLSAKTLQQEREKQHLLATQNERLEQQVTERTADLNRSLAELKATQSQLVQREKMASLGELTAGIAHEIQNPLNFVNNFSETNVELLTELKQEIAARHHQEAMALADDVIANEQKIAHHGRRADSIVKGMLQHSRGSSGEKQPTNLNALVEEYLKLAYQGYRARETSFAADVCTSYEPSTGKVSVVPHDIGRVLLNLFNNAFYAVQEKEQKLNGSFKPLVSVNTRKEGGHVTITVKDNGTGMSEKVAEKVFQPFFTTKPSGEGTGLGLSLSYDIITKGYGGNILVYSREGEGSEFVVELPAS